MILYPYIASTSYNLVGYQLSKCNCLGGCHNCARLYNRIAFAYSIPCDALHHVVILHHSYCYVLQIFVLSFILSLMSYKCRPSLPTNLNRIVSNICYVKERDLKNFYACRLGHTKTFLKSYFINVRFATHE